jgi:opacity protein-like surface antigen
MRLCVVLVTLLAAASPAAAQSTYVGASLVSDIARFSKIVPDEGGVGSIIGGAFDEDGAALGFNVKIGRGITDRWGVEFEFARSGEFEHRANLALPALIPQRLDLRVPIELEFASERTHTSLAALAWVRQDLGDRVELSYLAGVAFNRVESEFEYDGPRIAIFPPVSIPGYETIFYDVGPAVGVEAAFKFGSAAVTGGVRLQSAGSSSGSGWLIRPNVGMRWTF